MKKVFIDTNIYLAFFEVTKDDLAKLSEAFDLASHQELEFITTKQIKAEFLRRRASTVSKSLSVFEELKIPAIPAMAKGIAEMEDFVKARKVMSASHKALAKALRDSAKGLTLDADTAVQKLFETSTLVETTKENVQNAQLRLDCGNPPGKKGSLGDAINWESLLSLPDFHDELILVTQDRDFRDQLDVTKINSFLQQEWSASHSGPLKLYQSLKEFLAEYFADVDVSSFSEVDAKITALSGSRSFAETHSAISELLAVGYFTRKQALRLVQALDGNQQVNWIFGDDDVRSFFQNLLTTCEDRMDTFEVSYLEEMLAYDGEGAHPIYIPF